MCLEAWKSYPLVTYTSLISPVPWPTLKLLLKNAQRSQVICLLKASAAHYKNTSRGKCALFALAPLPLWDRTKWFALQKWLFSETLGLQKGKRTSIQLNRKHVCMCCATFQVADQSIPTDLKQAQKWFMNDAFQTSQFHSWLYGNRPRSRNRGRCFCVNSLLKRLIEISPSQKPLYDTIVIKSQ